MALILNIDTSSAVSHVFLASGKQVLAAAQNDQPMNHASFIDPAIRELFKSADLKLSQVDAVAVVSGPGSYTGLRVGLATAKGLCYALGKPLIFLNSLELLAAAAREKAIENGPIPENILFCPMIDARRMEVFTALYNKELALVEPPQALILSDTSFSSHLERKTVIFCGNGSPKFQPVCTSPNAIFSIINYTVRTICDTSTQLFDKNKFVDLAYSEPFYLKEFFSNFKKK